MKSAKSPTIGRPRGFSTDEALDQAVLVFWEQGYDGASLTDLTTAMGISRTSMYAAFGNKEDLFKLALNRYVAGPGAYTALAVDEPTARGVASAYLHGAARVCAGPDGPRGCPVVKGGLAASPSGLPARELVAAIRSDGWSRITLRLQRAQDEGDLPQDSNPGLLARYLMTVANGIAVQAAGGTGADELHQVVEVALLNWPSS